MVTNIVKAVPSIFPRYPFVSFFVFSVFISRFIFRGAKLLNLSVAYNFEGIRAAIGQCFIFIWVQIIFAF